MPQSVVNKVTVNASGNYAAGVGKFDPGKIRGIILHPDDADLLSTANLATPALRKAALQALLINQTYNNRAFFIHKLMMPTSNGEGVSYETREQHKKQVDKGTWDMLFVVDGTWAEYQALQNFHLRTGYLAAFVDENWNLQHLNTETGICGLTVHEVSIPMFEEPETGKAVKYQLRIALSDIDEKKKAKHTELGFNPFHPLTGLRGIEDTVIEKIANGSTGVFHISLKSADGQTNLVPNWAAVLNVASAWKIVNATGAAVTIASVAIISEGLEQVAFALTCTTSGNYGTAGDTLYVSQASIATLAGLGVKYHESNIITVLAT